MTAAPRQPDTYPSQEDMLFVLPGDTSTSEVHQAAAIEADRMVATFANGPHYPEASQTPGAEKTDRLQELGGGSRETGSTEVTPANAKGFSMTYGTEQKPTAKPRATGFQPQPDYAHPPFTRTSNVNPADEPTSEYEEAKAALTKANAALAAGQESVRARAILTLHESTRSTQAH